MSSNIVRVSNLPAPMQPPVAVNRVAHAENPLLLLHRFIRGRYPLACCLALLLAVPGGIAGYLAARPTYTSTGIVRVAPTLPRLLYQYEDNQVPPHFDSFVSTQASMLSNRRVIDLAASNEDLRKAGWPSGPEGITRLTKALKVNNRRGSELIVAQVEHPDPRLAQLAVNAILTAYESVQDELTGMTATDRERHLRELRGMQERQIELTRAQIRTHALRYHTENLDPLLNETVLAIGSIRGRLEELELQLAAARAVEAARAAAAQSPGDHHDVRDLSAELELEYYAARDRLLAGLVQEHQSVKTAIDSRSQRLGPVHREIVNLRHRLQALQTDIGARVAFIRDNNLYPAMPLDSPANPGAIAQLEQLRTELRDLLTRREAEARDIGNTRFAIASLQDRRAAEEQSLRTTTTRLEQIEIENTYAAAGRISVLQRGDLPPAPSKDRRIPLAVFGTLGGAGLGVGVVVLLTLLRGGYRYIDELERAEGSAAVLGTVPDLNAGGADHASLAALSIHHLRNMLQMNAPRTDGGVVYSVSSALAGDGKTSLALSLAMSFAAMGNRTVLIDADLVGRGLSRQLGLSSAPGLCQALKATTLNGEVHATRLANLWAIPVGHGDGEAAGPIQPEHIAQSDLRRVLDLARQDFDTVIIDTGPILGSLEANLIAPLSDRVVLVVSRGQPGKLVRSAIDRLSRLGATCGGLIFNRADFHDFDRSISAVSLSGRSLRDQAAQRHTAAMPGALALLDAVSAHKRDA
jgi:polysaccharide biosynthesis transport protein